MGHFLQFVWFCLSGENLSVVIVSGWVAGFFITLTRLFIDILNNIPTGRSIDPWGTPAPTSCQESFYPQAALTILNSLKKIWEVVLYEAKCFQIKMMMMMMSRAVAWGGAGGTWAPPNNFDGQVWFGQRPHFSRCSSVQCVHFNSIKRENCLFMASTKKNQAGIKQIAVFK